MSCFFVRFLIGLVICLIIIGLFGLAYGDYVWTFVFLPVICTAGLISILYVPIIYFIGFLVQKILNLLLPSVGHLKCASIEADTSNSETKLAGQKAIMKYILQVEDTIDKEQIIMNLYEAGWSRTEIESAFDTIE